MMKDSEYCRRFVFVFRHFSVRFFLIIHKFRIKSNKWMLLNMNEVLEITDGKATEVVLDVQLCDGFH